MFMYAVKKWGVGSYNCFMILTAALNGGLIQIEKDNPDYNPASGKSKKKIPDPVATAAANAKRRELEEAFREWAWKDEGRAAMLADIYNRKLNRVAARTYSGDYLSLPGMSPDIQLRKHQRDAVARIIQDGEGTLIAHTVGAGKTFTGITAMHELKRLGRARKPMIVVPNNLTEQWAADYLKLYPDAKLLVLTDAAAKSPDSVRRFWGQAAAGDWDAVIVGFSRFEKLQMSYGAQKAALTARIDDLDCPWRPSDLEQRLGRIVRQGNTFDRVHDFRYVSTGTFDSYLYSIVERKQRFISQVFTNKSPVRTMDDLDETVLSLAQMKQIAEGDPTVAERMDVENKIGQLKLMLASHLDGLADVQHKIETQYRPLVEALTAQRDMLADDEIPFAEADLVRQQTLGSKDSFLTVGGTHIADKEEAIRALRRAAYDVRPGCEETIGTYRGLSVVCRRQRVLDDDWLPYIGLAVDAARHVHMSDRVFPSGEKGAFTVLTQMDRIIARDAKGPAEIELKLRDAQLALADAQKAAREPFPKQAELDEAEQRLAVLEQERIEAEAQRQREQAQRAEAEAAAIEEGVEEERAAEREHERAAVADDEAREAGRVAELRRQGLICEDSATHAAATAAPNGIASGCPDDVAEAARCSAAASAREEAGGGEKHKAGM